MRENKKKAEKCRDWSITDGQIVQPSVNYIVF